MNTQTGVLHLTYNAMWGHYAFHWESQCGSSVEDDGGEVREIIEDFKGDVNNPNWFIEKAESELDFAMEEGSVKKGDNWCCTWLMEGGYIEDWWFN
jgi:hypothetical protein